MTARWEIEEAVSGPRAGKPSRLVFNGRQAVVGHRWCDELVIRRPDGDEQRQHISMGAAAFDALAELVTPPVTPRPYPQNVSAEKLRGEPIYSLAGGGFTVELEDSLNIVIVSPRPGELHDARITVTNVDLLIEGLTNARIVRDIREAEARQR
jgi:hypothetical protein